MTDEICEAQAANYEDEALRLFPFAADSIVDRVRLEPGNRVLEIGCGAGALTIPLARSLGPGRVQAIDHCEAMIVRCEAAARRASLSNIDLHQMAAERLEFRQRYFDLTISAYTLEQIIRHSRPETTIAGWKRVTREGGLIVIATPAASSFQPMADDLAERVRLAGRGCRSATGNEESLAGLLEAAGLEEITIDRFDTRYHLQEAEEWWRLVTASDAVVPLDHLNHSELERLWQEHRPAIESMRTAEGWPIEVTTLLATARRP